MTEILIVRQTSEEAWQWCQADSRAGWRETDWHSGDLEALGEGLPRAGIPTLYLVPGERVVAQQLTVESRERRHLNKLVPYQLEEQIVDPIDDLHFALGALRDNKLVAAYTGLDHLGQDIAELESAGCDIRYCVPDFLALQREAGGWTLLLDGDRLLVHSGEGLGFSTDRDLAQPALTALIQRQGTPAQLTLAATTATDLVQLRSLLADALNAAPDVAIVEREEGFWNLLNIKGLPEVDFRTGALGRRLPLTRWWREWRTPAIATAAAFVLAIVVTAGQYWQAQQEQQQILADMRAVYQQAVPNADANVRDPERRLESLVSGLGGSEAGSNLMRLLSEVGPAVEKHQGLAISSFRYSQEARELQLNLEAEDFALLESLRSDISERGLEAELLRVSAQGDLHEARMRVGESRI